MQEVPPEVAEAAKVMAAGGFGAMVLVYLRHPGSLMKALFMVAIGVGLAVVFTEPVAEILGIRPIPVAAAIGILGKPFAQRAVEWIEAMEWRDLLKKGKP